MRLAEAVPTDDQRRSLLVVHRHPREGFPDVVGRGHRIRLSLGAFGIDVDQAHGGGTEGLGELPFAGVSLVGAQPLILGTPEDLFRFPDVLPTEAESERFEPHGLERRVTGEHQQIGPRNLVAVLLLDRPQQPTRLVQVGVVRPTVQWRKALRALTPTASSVERAVGAGGVPAHTNEESAVVAVVGRPPIFRSGHHRDDVGFELVHVELLEFRFVVELFAERVRFGGMRMQDGQVHLLRPPVLVRQRCVRLGLRRLDDRILALAGAGGLGGGVGWACVGGHELSFPMGIVDGRSRAAIDRSDAQLGHVPQ
ncbi:unannotated protein [freshwater metagenome]|uniref:Unannotated protein n=1 Tax=freshwater metagenome TaxID=449393 RepID=A0A6J7EJE6_9ZZZZ